MLRQTAAADGTGCLERDWGTPSGSNSKAATAAKVRAQEQAFWRLLVAELKLKLDGICTKKFIDTVFMDVTSYFYGGSVKIF